MGVLFGPRAQTQARQARMWGITSASDLIPPRPGQRPGPRYVSNDSSMRHSAMWAGLTLRAALISTLPLDIYRRVNGAQVACPVPEVLRNPAGNIESVPGDGYADWMFASQWGIDWVGNTVGLITARDGLGLPSRVELAPTSDTSIIVRGGELWKYRIGGTLYDPSQIWHERGRVIPGLVPGLSTVAYAAMSLGEYFSVQDFAANWFGTGAVPRARLKNTAKTIDPRQAAIVKESWNAAISANEPFVHGNDWEYDLLQAEQASADWLEAKKYSITDVARFIGVPADLIDSEATGATGRITYQNITQRNLQFLILQLGPAIIRRENALTALTPRPRYVKLNTDAFLRLDPLQRVQLIKEQIDSRTLAPSEARELDDRPPFTDSQLAEFDRFWPPKAGTSVTPGQGHPAVPAGEPVPAIEPAGPLAIEAGGA